MTFHGSYHQDDVTFLLKPAAIDYVDVAEKEQLIQSGRRHYSEMLSPEKVPSPTYMRLYDQALARNARRLNGDIRRVASDMLENVAGVPVIVSLARAGTPIGVLLQRTFLRAGLQTSHYSVSIIRGRGIDMVAMEEIAARHGKRDIVFVDGWTGKGAIATELQSALQGTGIVPRLAVVADPAGCAKMASTTDDYVIPSGILNGIVSGLVSRSVLNDDVVGVGDYHACLHQTHLAEHDRTLAFIDAIMAAEPVIEGTKWTPAEAARARTASARTISDIMREQHVDDVNRVKPGIAEATRAILRRLPHSVHLRDEGDVDTLHVVELAREANVPIHRLPAESPYRAITVIRSVAE